MKTVLPIDYTVIVFYLLLTLFVGFYFVRFNRGAADFFRGNNKIPWLIAGLSSFMSGFSAWTFTGAAGIAYNEGITIVLMYIGSAVCFFIGYFFFASRWRRTRISTVMEYLRERFDEPTRQTFSWLTTLFQLFIAASVLFGLGIFVSSVCGFSLILTILIAGVIILLYCFFGGLWAVMITDFIQGIILIPFTLIMVFVALDKVGGFSALIQSLPPEFLTVGHSEMSSQSYIFAFFLVNAIAYNSSVNAQRYFSVDTEKSAKKISLLAGTLFFVGAFIWFIPPMVMRVLYPNIATIFPQLTNPEEASYSLASLTLLPNGLIGVMLAAMFSASMSSLSSFYNMHSGIISNDIFRTLAKWEPDDKRMLFVGRLTTLGVGILVPTISVLMAKSGSSVFVTMLTFNALITLAYGPPALLGLLEKKSPHYSGLVSFMIALTLGILGAFVLKWSFVTRVFVIIPASVAAYYACGLLGLIKPESADYLNTRRKFFQKLKTPINIKSELDESEDISCRVFRFLARITVLISLGCMLLVFWIPASELNVLFSFVGMALGLAALFYLFSRHNKSTD